MSTKGTPTLIFGAGAIGTTAKSFTFTWDTPQKVSDLLEKLKDLEITELDSAASYPPYNPWNTEYLLGQVKAAEKGFVIDSKVAVHEGNLLDEESVEKSLNRGLELLGVEKLHIYYAHMPNEKTPAEETARAFHKQFLAGRFEKLGLCNYTYKQMKDYLAVCEEHGYVKPSVYQGHYNAIVRNYEKDLIPLLREHGIKFYAFSPLGGGFLTGKVTLAPPDKSTLQRTRFHGESTMPYYPKTFDKPIIHAALRKLHDKCSAHGLSLTEVSLRWIMHHSALRADDAVILGAKRVEQLESNVADCRKGPLNAEIVKAVEEMWEEVCGDVVVEAW